MPGDMKRGGHDYRPGRYSLPRGWMGLGGGVKLDELAGRLPKQKSYTLNFISNFCVIILTTNDVRKILLYITTALWVE